MNTYLTNDAIGSLNPYLLFIQPYKESIYNFGQIFNEEKSLSSRAKHAAVGVLLLIPMINTLAFLILRAGSVGVVQLSIKGGELHFNWEDINALAQYHFGLRHVSSRESWTREASEGFSQGCSLSLMPHKSQFAKNHKWDQISLQDRGRIIKSFEAGVDQFIQGSLIHDAKSSGKLMELNKTFMGEVASLTDICYFSVVKYRTSLPSDLSSWSEGLGRHPKQTIPAHQIVALQPIRVQDLGYSEANLQKVIQSKDQAEELYQRMVACYRSSLIRTLRGMPELGVEEVDLLNFAKRAGY